MWRKSLHGCAPLSTAFPPLSRSTSFQKTVLYGASFFGLMGKTSPFSISSSRTCCVPVQDSLSDLTATPPDLSLLALMVCRSCAGVLMLWSAWESDEFVSSMPQRATAGRW